MVQRVSGRIAQCAIRAATYKTVSLRLLDSTFSSISGSETLQRKGSSWISMLLLVGSKYIVKEKLINYSILAYSKEGNFFLFLLLAGTRGASGEASRSP